MEIVFDSKPPSDVGQEQRIPSWLIQTIKNGKGQPVPDALFLVDDDKLLGNATSHHVNMAAYFEACCWLGVGSVIRPDMVYFTILNEITLLLQEKIDCNVYKGVENDEKLNIMLEKQLQPQFAKLVSVSFSTDMTVARESRLACLSGSSANALPYQQTVPALNELRKIRIEGSLQDWSLLLDLMYQWSGIISAPIELASYANKAAEIVSKIIDDVKSGSMTKSFWHAMYPTRHSQEVDGSFQDHPHGWVGDLYNLRGKEFQGSFGGHVTRIDWVAPDGKHFVSHHGLFASKIDNSGYLIPIFCRVKFEKSIK